MDVPILASELNLVKNPGMFYMINNRGSGDKLLEALESLNNVMNKDIVMNKEGSCVSPQARENTGEKSSSGDSSQVEEVKNFKLKFKEFKARMKKGSRIIPQPSENTVENSSSDVSSQAEASNSLSSHIVDIKESIIELKKKDCIKLRHKKRVNKGLSVVKIENLNDFGESFEVFGLIHQSDKEIMCLRSRVQTLETENGTLTSKVGELASAVESLGVVIDTQASVHFEQIKELSGKIHGLVHLVEELKESNQVKKEPPRPKNKGEKVQLPRVYSSRRSCHSCGSMDHFKNRCPKVKREKQKIAKEKFEAQKLAKNLKEKQDLVNVKVVKGIRRIERPKELVERLKKVPVKRGTMKLNPEFNIGGNLEKRKRTRVFFNRTVYNPLIRVRPNNHGYFRENNDMVIIGGSKARNLAQEYGMVYIEASTPASIEEMVNQVDLKQARLATNWSKEASSGQKKESMALLQDAERKLAIGSKRSSKRNYQENGPSAYSTSPSPSTTQAINLKQQVYTPTKSRSSMEQPVSRYNQKHHLWKKHLWNKKKQQKEVARTL